MRRAAVVMLIWGCELAFTTSLMAIFGNSLQQWFQLGGASLAMAFTATIVFLFGGHVPDEDPDRERPVTELSIASACTGLGVGLLVLSARFGVWLALVSGALILAGLLGIGRELHFERRARRVREVARPGAER